MIKIALALIALLLSVGPALAANRPVRTDDIKVNGNYKVEVVAQDLSAPTMVAFDEMGRMIIAESGYDTGKPKVTRLETNGQKTVLVDSEKFGKETPVTAVGFHRGLLYVVHAGSVSTLDQNGDFRTVLSGLPGQGDHQANQIVFKGDQFYLGVGTVTNSGVVGEDNAVFGWLKNQELRQLRDVPCREVTVAGSPFASEHVFEPGRQTQTSPYSPFGSAVKDGTVIPGSPKCNGAILRANLDGSDLEVFAWGLRNPYGLEWGSDGNLYVTMHGFDARGSRPIENAWDCFYKITEDAWYGWPDYACDVPVTNSRFRPKDKPQPNFILKNHPTTTPPKPIARFQPHSATNGFAFAPNAAWGKPTDAYIALFGDFTPATGTVKEPQGVKVVKLDTTNGRITDFLTNQQPGQASRHSAGGLEHPSDVTFGPDGAMYVTDWGIARVSAEGLKLEPNSGVVWKVSSTTEETAPIVGGSSFYYNLLRVLILAGLTLLAAGTLAAKRWVQHPARHGIEAGAIAAVIMGAFAMFIASPILKLPWYTPTRVFASMVMGEAALANILEFSWLPFLVGLVVVVVLGILVGWLFVLLLRHQTPAQTLIAGTVFGLAVWALAQYFLFPMFWPLVVEKGFPPLWYAAAFAVLGTALGWQLGNLGRYQLATTRRGRS